jgi:hypothetical protein
MKPNYFSNCKTLEEVKRRYKELALIHHPDRGGDTATMQKINAEYESICNNPFFSFSEQSDENQAEFIKYPEIINQLMKMDGIVIELIGNWLWVSGNTYPHRKDLSKIGLFFAPKKIMWYYRPAEYKSSSKKTKPIEAIRRKYGSKMVNSNFQKMELN